MSVRQEPPIGRLAREIEVSHYDVLLATLPLPLVMGTLAAVAVGTSVAYGAGAGALLSALLLGYALFVAAPTDLPDEPEDSDRFGGSEGVDPTDD